MKICGYRFNTLQSVHYSYTMVLAYIRIQTQGQFYTGGSKQWTFVKATTGGSVKLISTKLTNLWECMMVVPLSWQYDTTIHSHRFVMGLLQWHKICKIGGDEHHRPSVVALSSFKDFAANHWIEIQQTVIISTTTYNLQMWTISVLCYKGSYESRWSFCHNIPGYIHGPVWFAREKNTRAILGSHQTWITKNEKNGIFKSIF